MPTKAVTVLNKTPHAFVRGKFRRGERGGQWPEETCDVCGCDPRNAVHVANNPASLIWIEPHCVGVACGMTKGLDFINLVI
jgi:hypothetical protein